MRVDQKRNVWSSVDNEMHWCAPDGALPGKLSFGGGIGNLCFGGSKRDQLFITARADSSAGLRRARRGAPTAQHPQNQLRNAMTKTTPAASTPAVSAPTASAPTASAPTALTSHAQTPVNAPGGATTPWPPAVPLIAILRGIRQEEAVAHVRVLLDAGFGCIEIPTNSPDWERSVRLAADHAGSRGLVGAGTVLEIAQVRALKAAGGRIAVSPDTCPEVIAEAVREGLISLPGAMTVSEVFAARRAGAHGAKIFPAATLGPGFVRAIRAVVPHDFPLFAVGGVTPDNLGAWLASGCLGAGLGSDLYKPGQSCSDTAARAAAFIQAWHAYGGAAV